MRNQYCLPYSWECLGSDIPQLSPIQYEKKVQVLKRNQNKVVEAVRMIRTHVQFLLSDLHASISKGETFASSQSTYLTGSRSSFDHT